MKLFAIRDFRHLFSAQIIALFGTGLATVALGLLAYDLAGPSAGAVLATATVITQLGGDGESIVLRIIATVMVTLRRNPVRTSLTRKPKRT